MTTTTDEHAVAPATHPLIVSIREKLEKLKQPPPLPQIAPVPSIDERIDRYYQRRGTTRAEAEAAREAKRREVHPELVEYDDWWKTVVEDWKVAYPNYNSRGIPNDHGLGLAAAGASLSGDARDLGDWFSRLKLWDSSGTRSERFKCEKVKGPETPEQREKRYQKWLAAVRNGKRSQKAATSLRRHMRQSEREYEAATTGGSVSVSKSGRKTVLTKEARDARALNISRYNQTRLSDNRPATVNLPFIKNKKRSQCEEDVMRFALDQLFPETDMLYSEWRPDRVSEIGVTWRGNVAKWERDIDVLLKDGKDVAAEFQIQTKGCGFWYVLLRRAIKETGCVIPGYQPKALESLFRILSTIEIRSILNEIQGTCNSDHFRPLLFCSAKSVHTWVKSKHTYNDASELLDLFVREDTRFRRYFQKFFKTVFPREAAIIRAAGNRLRSELKEMGNPQINAETVAEGFAICLSRAKSEAGYTDDRVQLATRFRQLKFNSKIRKQVLKDLPSWFRATPTVPKNPKRDRKGRFA